MVIKEEKTWRNQETRHQLMAQVKQAKSQVEGAVITHRVANKCRVSIKKAITPIGKVHPRQRIHTTGQIPLGGWWKNGTEVGRLLTMTIMMMTNRMS